MEQEKLAKLAYDAYCEEMLNHNTFTKTWGFTPWHLLSNAERVSWEASVAKVILNSGD